MRLLLCVLFFFVSIFGLTQNLSDDDQKEIGRLKSVGHDEALHDTVRVKALTELANYYYLYDLDTTISICLEAKALADKSGDLWSKSESYGWLGYLYSEKGEVELSLKYNEQCLEFCRDLRDKEAIATALNNLASTYNNIGRIEEALQNHYEVLRIRESMKDSAEMARALNSIGLIYKNQGFIDKAIDYYQQSLAIRRRTAPKVDIATSLNNLGVIYYNAEDYEKAYDYHVQALDLRRSANYPSGIANSLNNLALSLEGLGRFEEAEKAFIESFQIRTDLKEKAGLCDVNIDYGRFLFHRGRYREAKPYAEEGFKIANELGYLRLIRNSSRVLSDIYEQEGQGQKALEMFKIHVAMNDSILNLENQRIAVVNEANYAYEKKRQEDIADEQKREVVRKEADKRKNLWLISGAILLVLIIAFLFVLMNRLKVTRAQKEVIREQKRVVDVKNEEIMASINYAERIQNAILPDVELFENYFPESFILYKPKDIVAGDFYWLEKVGGKIVFAVADCTGHGVPGAMVSVVCHHALSRSVNEFKLTSPGKILDKTRDLVVEEFSKNVNELSDGMDISLCVLDGRTLHYAGAFNPLWLVRGNNLIETKGDKRPIGKFMDNTSFTEHQIEIESGDRIYLFSDGFADQFGGPKGKKYMSKNFKKWLLDNNRAKIKDQGVDLAKEFDRWRGQIEQIDDVCVMGVQF